MKKTVKSLIIAASVAAIAGIGAVSFAAWNGKANLGQTANGANATIDAFGFKGTSSINLQKNLIPHDQQVGVNTDTMTYEWVAELELEGAGLLNYKMQAKVECAKSDETYTLPDANAEAGTGKTEYRYKITKADIAPTAATAKIDNITGYYPFSNTEEPADVEGLTGNLTEGKYYVQIILVSDNGADMGVKPTFTFSLKAK